MAPLARTSKRTSQSPVKSRVGKGDGGRKSSKRTYTGGGRQGVISSKGKTKKSSSDELGDQILLMEAELAALAADMNHRNEDIDCKKDSNSSPSNEEYEQSGWESGSTSHEQTKSASKSGGQKSFIVIAKNKFDTSSGEQTSTEDGSSGNSESDDEEGSDSESISESELQEENESEDGDAEQDESANEEGNISNEEEHSDQEGKMMKRDVKIDEESIHTDPEDANGREHSIQIWELFNAAREGRDQDAVRILETNPDWILCMSSGPSAVELDRLRAMIPQNGDMPLHYAARAGLIGTVRELVLFIKDQSEPYSAVTMKLLGKGNCDGDTPLHVALKNRQVEVALYLVAERPEVAYQVNSVGVSPLFLAIEGGYMDLVNDVFLRCPGRFVLDSMKEGLQKAKKALLAHAAITARNLDILEQILGNLPGLVESQDERGWRPLSHAAYDGDIDAVCYILTAFPDSVKKRDKDGLFPIHKAVGGGHITIIKEMISRYNEAKYQVGEKGQTIVHIAQSEDKFQVFDYLKKLPDFVKIASSKVEDRRVKGKTKESKSLVQRKQSFVERLTEP